jgi:hypothetical protein
MASPIRLILPLNKNPARGVPLGIGSFQDDRYVVPATLSEADRASLPWASGEGVVAGTSDPILRQRSSCVGFMRPDLAPAATTSSSTMLASASRATRGRTCCSKSTSTSKPGSPLWSRGVIGSKRTACRFQASSARPASRRRPSPSCRSSSGPPRADARALDKRGCYRLPAPSPELELYRRFIVLWLDMDRRILPRVIAMDKRIRQDYTSQPSNLGDSSLHPRLNASKYDLSDTVVDVEISDSDATLALSLIPANSRASFLNERKVDRKGKGALPGQS